MITNKELKQAVNLLRKELKEKKSEPLDLHEATKFSSPLVPTEDIEALLQRIRIQNIDNSDLSIERIKDL